MPSGSSDAANRQEPFYDLTVDLSTYRRLTDIAALLDVDVEEALDRVIRDASYVYNSGGPR